MIEFEEDLPTGLTEREPINKRVDPLIATRYSPRAFKRQSLPEETIEALLDAARLAPSCYNEQPWQFYVSTPESHRKFVEFLVPDNAEWANDASLLMILTARRTFAENGKPNDYGRFDSGAAWYALTYQARTQGLHTHAMAGINDDKIRSELNISDDEDVVCAIAVGVLDEERASEESITDRKPLCDIVQWC